ncbi:hypothetical protein NEOLEDRAFT_1158554 [Neolentinus lepideus HHB14362 ss-1]|uniref:Uncharacterized protein n=1 Tax=Neolentinus lepideus HHB14362 ss-1 TaxID=1314782 RepID=A0A165P732_9AGAM|nr:hypothetical protein NEOLEDRAFT_1158554 [Neolentinus lepideus HHB14362 ss-1]
MLPKVANHILHHGARAVAAVQNQTGATIRNVLQLQGTSSPSTGLTSWNGASSSSWGSGGAGPGGAKYQSSSRFYSGYTGSGRAITHANASAAQDGDVSQADDDELRSQRPSVRRAGKSRARSHSLSVTGRERRERAESFGVLHAVQMHVRRKHTFLSSTVQAPELLESGEQLAVSTTHVHTPAPSRVISRRNSTASVSSHPDVPMTEPQPPTSSAQPLPSVTRPLSPIESASSESVSSEAVPAQSSRTSRNITEELTGLDENDAIKKALSAAVASTDYPQVYSIVQSMRTKKEGITHQTFTAALRALSETRRPGQPLHYLIDTYNDMIARSLLPSFWTYRILIKALTIRDAEVHSTIASLQSRAKRSRLSGRSEVALEEVDKRRIEHLQAENNFGSMMALFEAVCSFHWMVTQIPPWLFRNLMRSAAMHSNLEAALMIFNQVEKRADIHPSPSLYGYLISVFTDHNDIKGAEEVFNEFLNAAKEGKVDWTVTEEDEQPWFLDTPTRSAGERVMHLNLWNTMIEAYFRCGAPDKGVELLAQMMDSKAGESYGPADVPPPAPSTFTTVMSGFCRTGDIDSALAWFDKLLQQDLTARYPFEASLKIYKPDSVAWKIMLEALVENGRITDLNRLYARRIQDSDGFDISPSDQNMLFGANIQYLEENQLDEPQAVKLLKFIADQAILLRNQSLSNRVKPLVAERLPDWVRQCLRYGELDLALDVAEKWAYGHLQDVKELPQGGLPVALASIRVCVAGCGDLIFAVPHLSLSHALRAARLFQVVSLPLSEASVAGFIRAYELSSADDLSFSDGETLVDVLYHAESYRDAETMKNMWHKVLVDFAKKKVDVSSMSDHTHGRIQQSVERYFAQDPELGKQLLHPWADTFHPQVTKGGKEPKPLFLTTDNSTVSIDNAWSRHVGEFYPSHPKVTLDEGLARFKKGASRGVFPTIEVIGRLINSLGRNGKIDQLRAVYTEAQRCLVALENNKTKQSEAWFHIEDQMVIACAQSGLPDAAHIHRGRILENGGVPSADAYGSLISCVKETTDDAAHALSLFEEAQVRGVTPNTYMYNTIISKLAKARKADHALELFNQMKTMGHRATSVTYGAVIAACCRVGDAPSAEELFQEMISQTNFKPRVPPYNTMIQLYVHTKPNRERALFYYNALLDAHISPSAHTYKLLLDAYGTIEPVDSVAMEQVFDRIASDKTLSITGAHWASLINSYGCVQKNLDKALQTFESIPSHPTSARSPIALPDAVAYEALINVFVTLRRTDLIPKYAKRLQDSNIHMTAYIANLIIKGYAAAGDIEQARAVFENLADPPEGVAAPNNHVPHSPGAVPRQSTLAPVYREPSTWEAMVRAELGVGNRDHAVAVLERLKSRHYPPAVYARISGIMLDDSVSPWSSELSSPHSGSAANSN